MRTIIIMNFEKSQENISLEPNYLFYTHTRTLYYDYKATYAIL